MKDVAKVPFVIASLMALAVLGATEFPEVSAPRAVTAGPREHLLASYFAIDAWSPDNRYLLALETDLNGRLPEPNERCTLGLVDLQDANRFIPVTTTACWNFQEAAMAFWLSADEILFNDVREGKFRAVILNLKTKAERVLPMPVSALSEDRTWAVSINYARLSLTRPDYGYAGPGQDARAAVDWPDDDGLWTMDLGTGETRLILSVAAGRSQMVPTKPVPGKPGQPLAYYCHTVISRDGEKIFFLARSVNWFEAEALKASIWDTTSFTVNRDGTDLRRCFRDGWAGSHFNWAPDGSHRMIVTVKWDGDKTGEHWSKNMTWMPVEFTVGEEEKVRRLGGGFADKDWHCVYSPDGRFMSGETYWDKDFMRPWILLRLEDDAVLPLGRFFVPEAYRGGYWRCDLHARWRRDGRQLAFNSVHEGSRQIYVMDVTPKTPDRAEKSVALDGLWDFRLFAGKTLEDLPLPQCEPNERMIVPGCWDAEGAHWNERGTGVYRRSFELDRSVRDARLVIDGMALRARAWLDGRDLGLSVFPWMKIEMPTGGLAAGRHELVLAVDSTVDEHGRTRLFRDSYDFYANGGLHHGVRLEWIDRPDELRRVAVRTRDYRKGEVELEVTFAEKGPADFTASVNFDGAGERVVRFRNRRARVTVANPSTWSPAHPNLHTVTVTRNGQSVSARFGIRQVSTEKGRILLNGEPVFLKGVNRHEMHYEFGSATSEQLMHEDLANIKSLGGNFVRGAHYPQCKAFLDLCDEMGILVWEESLGWGNDAEQLGDPEFARLQEEELRMTVRASINHPSIVITGFLNEPHSDTQEALALVNRLVDVARSEDTGHLVTFACNLTETDISHVKTDIIAYNTYPCWYNDELVTGTREEMRENIRTCHDRIIRYFRNRYRDDRPFVVSEIGVKADYGVHDPRGKAQYSEDFQAEYTRIMLEETMARPEIAGIAIWQYADGKTYTRTKGLRGRSYGINAGGLYDRYRRPKAAVEEVRRCFAEPSGARR